MPPSMRCILAFSSTTVPCDPITYLRSSYTTPIRSIRPRGPHLLKIQTLKISSRKKLSPAASFTLRSTHQWVSYQEYHADGRDLTGSVVAVVFAFAQPEGGL